MEYELFECLKGSGKNGNESCFIICTYSGGEPRKLNVVKIISTRWPGPAKNIYKHCREWFDGLLIIGAVNVPFWGPPGRDTNVWSHSVNIQNHKNGRKCFYIKSKIMLNISVYICMQKSLLKSVRHLPHHKLRFSSSLSINSTLCLSKYALMQHQIEKMIPFAEIIIKCGYS